MTNASRAPVDLEALARDLRQEEARAQHAGSAKGDPLAELARIVGQDDPFRALLAARDEGRGTPTSPASPEAHLEPSWRGRIEPSFAPEAAAKPTPADAFDQYLASVEHDTHDEPYHGADEGHGAVHAVAAPDYAEGRDLRRVKPRRRLASVGAGLGLVALAITGALTYKALHRGSGGGGVPVVQADTTPLKVAPKVADGVEIPDQNRQIYEPRVKGKDGQIRIVNREEQPLDVSEAARAAQGTGPAGTQGVGSGTTPGSGPFEAFGEPRRVRTVAVRPESPPAPPRDAQADPLPSVIPTMVLPSDQPPAASRPKPIRQVSTVTAGAQTTPVQDAPPAVATQPPAPRPVAVKPPPKAAQRVAAVAPETAAQDAPDTTAATDSGPAVSEAAVGGFSVQLGVRNSAGDARAALRQMQGKYGQLAGKPELIRQAEVNGKTIYRVRVGPLAKAEASSLCTALQGAGGQCFVAKN